MTGKGPRSRRFCAGFTLLEVIISMALIAAVCGFLAAITGQWLPNWNRGLARVQSSAQLALGLERVVADLTAAEYMPLAQQTSQVIFAGGRRSVVFVRAALGPRAHAGLEFVRIAETLSDRGPAMVRTRAAFLPVVSDINDLESVSFNDGVVLIRAPYRLSFSYAGGDRVWRETWQASTQLPRAIKLTVADATGKILTASTATLIHASVPPECITMKSVVECVSSRERPSRTADGSSPQVPNAGQAQ